MMWVNNTMHAGGVIQVLSLRFGSLAPEWECKFNMHADMSWFNYLLLQNWYDDKFVWNSSDYGGIKEVMLPYDVAWRPDTLLYNK
jgi:hypothetical protein